MSETKIKPGTRPLPSGYRHATTQEICARVKSGADACEACAQPKQPGSAWRADQSKICLCDGCTADTKEGHIVATDPKPAPAKWEPIPASTKQTKAELIALANKLGAENARLKARLAKGGK